MIINKCGKYRLLSKLCISNGWSSVLLKEGKIFEITQVDTVRHKVIGPEFEDWTHWDIDAEPVEEEVW